MIKPKVAGVKARVRRLEKQLTSNKILRPDVSISNAATAGYAQSIFNYQTKASHEDAKRLAIKYSLVLG